MHGTSGPDQTPAHEWHHPRASIHVLKAAPASIESPSTLEESHESHWPKPGATSRIAARESGDPPAPVRSFGQLPAQHAANCPSGQFRW
jgi:hypothetical protein